MADTGYVIATAGANSGTVAWTNPGNITADDDNSASCALTFKGDTTSGDLQATFGGLSALIPDGADIDGIELRIQASQIGDLSIQVQGGLSKSGGTQVGSSKNFAGETGTLTNYSVGGSTDLWGTTWTRAEVIAAGFRGLVRGTLTGVGGSVNIDAAWVRIFYTPGTTEVDGEGLAEGSSDAEAVGEALRDGSGSATGAANAAAIGAAVLSVSGTAAGTSTADAVGDSISTAGAGLAEGAATAVGIGQALASSKGLAAGHSTAAASGSGRQAQRALIGTSYRIGPFGTVTFKAVRQL